jgi:hypothetical protein
MARKAARVPGWDRVTPIFDDQHLDDDPVSWEIRGMPERIKSIWNLEMGGKTTTVEDLEASVGKSKAARVAEKQKLTKEGDSTGMEEIAPTPYALKMVIENCVRGIENYEDADERPIRSGRELLLKGEAAAISDAYMAVFLKTFLTEELAKNLPKQPGS